MHEIFKGKSDIVLNYNPQKSPRTGIQQIIWPKENIEPLAEGLKRKKIEQTPNSRNQLGLSPRSILMGLWKKKALHLIRMEVLRYWERNASGLRDEAVAQIFENILVKAKNETKPKNKEHGME